MSDVNENPSPSEQAHIDAPAPVTIEQQLENLTVEMQSLKIALAGIDVNTLSKIVTLFKRHSSAEV